MVNNQEDYPYSSARSRITGEANNLLKEPLFDKMEMADYKLHLKSKEREDALEEIRAKTRLGKPLGGEDFMACLSEKLGQKITIQTKGQTNKEKGRINGMCPPIILGSFFDRWVFDGVVCMKVGPRLLVGETP
ncbi:MAG: hypothetical protein E3K32_03950 [wastewater metagenome]|nr:hypothetical protein [Candidatus Loosdrechtia aerotolerans]